MNWPHSLSTVLESTSSSLGDRLAADVGDFLQRAIAERGLASLMVSGGSTPHPFFAALSKRSLDWSRVTVGLVDERYVDADHADSNERLVRERLLTGEAANARFFGMYAPGGQEVALTESAQAFKELLAAQQGRLDVVVLGMGGDAHTASLFPVHAGNREQLVRALDLDASDDALVCSMLPSEAPHQRISLTLKPIVESRHLLLHITGEDKQRVLIKALETGDTLKAPIASVFKAKRVDPAIVYWAP